MSFLNIVGQERAVALLTSALKSSHLHHAYLFAGLEGVGKELTAVTLAQAANCERGDGDACGKCASCRKIAAFNHPDVLWVMPEAELVSRRRAGRADFSGAPSKDIRISQIRSLQEMLAFRPLEARTRFILICSAEAMNPQAQNALLKTLEEPPRDTVMILISSAPGMLLATIRSRCLRVDFSPLSTSMVADFLMSRNKAMERSDALRSAALSAGSLSAALALSGEPLQKLTDRLLRLSRLDAGDILDALHFAEEIAAEKGEAEPALRFFEAWFRDVALIASSLENPAAIPDGKLIYADMRDALEESARRIGAAESLRRIDLCRGVRRRLKFNASTRLQLEQLFLRMAASRNSFF